MISKNDLEIASNKAIEKHGKCLSILYKDYKSKMLWECNERGVKLIVIPYNIKNIKCYITTQLKLLEVM
jgi:hypothetical protein